MSSSLLSFDGLPGSVTILGDSSFYDGSAIIKEDENEYAVDHDVGDEDVVTKLIRNERLAGIAANEEEVPSEEQTSSLPLLFPDEVHYGVVLANICDNVGGKRRRGKRNRL